MSSKNSFISRDCPFLSKFTNKQKSWMLLNATAASQNENRRWQMTNETRLFVWKYIESPWTLSVKVQETICYNKDKVITLCNSFCVAFVNIRTIIKLFLYQPKKIYLSNRYFFGKDIFTSIFFEIPVFFFFIIVHFLIRHDS
jgi:hypothetical protein